MVAYVIADVTVTNPEKYKGYMALTPAAINAAGGKFVVRGGESVVLEGDWKPGRLVILEFPTLDAAKKFYASAQYQAAIKAREGAAVARLIAVQGV